MNAGSSATQPHNVPTALIEQLRERFGDALTVTDNYGITACTVSLIRMVPIENELRLSGGRHDTCTFDVTSFPLHEGVLTTADLQLLVTMLDIHHTYPSLSLTSLRQAAECTIMLGIPAERLRVEYVVLVIV